MSRAAAWASSLAGVSGARSSSSACTQPHAHTSTARVSSTVRGGLAAPGFRPVDGRPVDALLEAFLEVVDADVDRGASVVVVAKTSSGARYHSVPARRFARPGACASPKSQSAKRSAFFSFPFFAAKSVEDNS